MDKNNIKISVVVPVYNVEKYLAKCLDSIILQTYENLEIICVNDGSTDSSPQILEEYAKRDKRIQVINQKNQGLSGARNTGMKYMTGEYFTFVDSDDWVQLGAYQKFIDVLKHERRTIDIFVFNGLLYYQGQKISHSAVIKIFGAEDWGDFKKSHFKTLRNHKNPLKNTMAVWNKVYRTEWYKKHNFKFMDKMLGEDRLYSAQNYLATDNVYVLEDYLYCYRRQSESLCATMGENIFNLMTIADEVKKVYKSHKFYKQSIYSYWEYLLREGILSLKTCKKYLRVEYLEEVRKRLKPVVAKLDKTRYEKEEYYQLSEDMLTMEVEELRRKYMGIRI